jgi:hypothetical protein
MGAGRDCSGFPSPPVSTTRRQRRSIARPKVGVHTAATDSDLLFRARGELLDSRVLALYFAGIRFSITESRSAIRGVE